MDTKEFYEFNLIKNPELLKQYGWIDTTFDYSFNSAGFRCKEFTSKPTIMFLGCSHTCGIGLPVDNIWPELVAKSMNMECANLGQGGGSADTAFRLCLGWIDKIKPNIVIFLRPPSIRWEIVSENRIQFLGAGVGIYADTYIQDYIIDDNNEYFNHRKNILAIESLCIQRNIKFLNFDGLPALGDLARDLQHSGVNTHQQFANSVLSKI
jgi:hypothetical protein